MYGISSLINHDCDPSCEALLYPTARLEIRARRWVAAGEEITISYLGAPPPILPPDAPAQGRGDHPVPAESATSVVSIKNGSASASSSSASGGWLSVSQRRARLAHGYGFECRCARCTAEAGAAAAALKQRRQQPAAAEVQ